MAVFTVSNTNTSGAGSLAQALLNAAANGIHTADTIVFSNAMAGQVFDMGIELYLAQDLTIDGDVDNDGDADITISGGNSHRLITVGYGYTVTLDSLILSDGFDSGTSGSYYGGRAASAVLNSGTLTITNSLVQNNNAFGGNAGPPFLGSGYHGGDAATILNYGHVTIANTIFSGNAAAGGIGSSGDDGQDANAAAYLYSHHGYSGGRGGHAASVLLQFGFGASLDNVTIQANTAVGGAGGNGGQGGDGDGPGYGGGDGGSGIYGGAAGAVVIGTHATGNVRFTAPQIRDGGLGGTAGSGGAEGGSGDPGTNGNAGAKGKTDAIVLLTGATGHVGQVTNTNDSGVGSLRYAIANATAGDTIYFDASLKGQVIRLTSAELQIVQDLTLNGDVDGDGKADITISGDANNNNVADSGDVRILNVLNSAHLTVRSLTLTSGYAVAGGAIMTDVGTSLTLINSTVSDSKAPKGGGIFSSGTLTALNVTIVDNAAFLGGGVYVKSSDATFYNATVTRNFASADGGGFEASGNSFLLLTNSTVSGNEAYEHGGGIDVFGGNAWAVMRNSIVSANTAGTSSPDVSDTGFGANFIYAITSLIGTGVTLDYSVGTNIFSDDPGLLGLDDNGGPVATMALEQGSAAIAHGAPLGLPLDVFDIDNDGDTAERLPLDANGGPRQIGTLDLGAVEFTGPLVTTTSDSETVGGSFAEDVADGSGLSLREAIFWADEGETITFASALAGQTIRLNSELVLSRDVTINGDTNGDGRADITLSGDADGDGIADGRILKIVAGDATLQSLTLTKGKAIVGGAILSYGAASLSLIRSTVSDSEAMYGGGIYAGGNLYLLDSTLHHNHAGIFGFGLGGAISASDDLTIVNTTIAHNSADSYGGGIDARSGSRIKLYSSTITGNSAGNQGGGLNLDGAQARVLSSIISGNTANSATNISKGGAYLAAYYSLLGTDAGAIVDYGYYNAISNTPLLGALGDRGGPVWTMVPLSTSSAINQGVAPVDILDQDRDGKIFSELLPFDARGGQRTFGHAPDIGAAEKRAVSDGGAVTENAATNTASGNVLTNDAAASTVTGVRTGAEAAGVPTLGAGVGTAVTGTYGSLMLAANGAWTYTLNNADPDTNALVGGAVVIDRFTYRTLAAGLIDTAELVVTITGANDAPVITSNGAGATASISYTENATVAVTTVIASDPDTGASRTFSIAGGADASKFKINATTGVLTFVAAPDFDAPTDSGANNVYNVIVRATDNGGLTDDQAIAVTILNIAGRTIKGTKNNDTINGTKPAGKTATSEEDKIDGKKGNDKLSGLGGNDTLIGGDGMDKLTGGAGRDAFVFNTKLLATNVDKIKDFTHDVDVIHLDDKIFKKIGTTLDAREFYAKKGATEAHDKDDRIIYDKKSGKLYYDADGNEAGGVDAIHFATLSNKPASLDSDDFLIV